MGVQIFVKTIISRDAARSSGTGLLQISRELTNGATDQLVARGTTLLALGADLQNIRRTDAPADFGRARYPFSNTPGDEQIDAFAAASGDAQSPHMSRDAARELSGDDDRRLVHGMMTLGRALGLALGEIPQLRSRDRFVPFSVKGEFMGPVRSGDAIEFALAPAKGALGAVLVRKKAGPLVFRATFNDPRRAAIIGGARDAYGGLQYR